MSAHREGAGTWLSRGGDVRQRRCQAQPAGAQVAEQRILKVRAREGFLRPASGLGCLSPEQRCHQPIAACVGILLLLPVEGSGFWTLERIYLSSIFLCNIPSRTDSLCCFESGLERINYHVYV